MKKMKKIFALLIAMVMVLGMSTSVFAGSITITRDETYDGTTSRTYSAYKVFDADYDTLSGSNTQANKDNFTYSPDGAAVAYTMASDNPWVPVMTAAGQTWFTVAEDANGNYVVTPKVDKDEDGNVTKEYYATASDAADFASYLQQNIPTGATATTVTAGGAAVTVDDGYYLLVADDGAPTLALVTTDVTIVEKNTYISASKTAEEAAYQIGDKVEYTATVVIPANTALTQEAGEDDVDEDEDGYVDGHAPIILHDTMDSTLTFAGEIKEATGIAADGYTLVTEPEDNCTFELVIPVTEDLLGKTITFKYEAEVNSTAAGEDGLVNELKGEFNGYETTPDSPVVYTFDFSFKKLFDGSEDENLTATFVLQDANGTVIPLTKIDDTHYAVKDSDDTAVTDNLITIKNGQEINIKGLKEATYKLVEKSTDTGYNLLDAPVTIVITDETDAGEDNVIQDSEIARSITVDGEELGENVYTFDVVNNQGSVLPSTGGIGTTIFYIVGSILVIGAGVVLVTRRRMNVQ